MFLVNICSDSEPFCRLVANGLVADDTGKAIEPKTVRMLKVTKVATNP